jgi:hypothetical protein
MHPSGKPVGLSAAAYRSSPSQQPASKGGELLFVAMQHGELVLDRLDRRHGLAPGDEVVSEVETPAHRDSPCSIKRGIAPHVSSSGTDALCEEQVQVDVIGTQPAQRRSNRSREVPGTHPRAARRPSSR